MSELKSLDFYIENIKKIDDNLTEDKLKIIKSSYDYIKQEYLTYEKVDNYLNVNSMNCENCYCCIDCKFCKKCIEGYKSRFCNNCITFSFCDYCDECIKVENLKHKKSVNGKK